MSKNTNIGPKNNSIEAGQIKKSIRNRKVRLTKLIKHDR